MNVFKDTPAVVTGEPGEVYEFCLPLTKPMMLSMNERKHWSVRHRITRYWRELAHIMARQSHIPAMDRARIVVTYTFGDKRKRDPGNYQPVAKAIVDGLVDAKILVDDSTKYVDGPDPRGKEDGRPRITVQLFPLVDGGWL